MYRSILNRYFNIWCRKFVTRKEFLQQKADMAPEMYLNIDMRKHHSRECHTHSRMHTYTHSIQLCFFAITPSRTHYHWKQYAKEAACKGNRQPGALLYYNSHNIHYIIHIWLIFLVKHVQDYSMFWDQYLSQSHAHQCAELYLSSQRRR